mgnify:CR=1 FL=1
MKLTKAQNETIKNITTTYMTHMISRKYAVLSFGAKDNRIGVTIDSKGKIESALVIH